MGGSCLILAAVIAIFTMIFSALFHTAGEVLADADEQTTVDEQLVSSEETPEVSGDLSLHFVGVGDNLLHDVIFTYFEEDYNSRDFSPIYENTTQYTQNADLAYINFETVCAGDDYGLSGYPNFNGPVEMIDTLAGQGFDWFSTSSNHSMDVGIDGLFTEMEYLEEHWPDIAYTGTHLSQEAADTPVVIDVNGIKVGLAGFTYGMNGYTLPDGYDYAVDLFLDYDMTEIDYEAIDAKIDALQDVSDVQIVAMHWGVEYAEDYNEIQSTVAQYLNSKGVEVIIGTHPHVIQPVEFIVSEDQTTLCYYSLGNFVSAQDTAERMIGGMADFVLNYNTETGEVSFSDVKFVPTITYISPDLRTYRTYTIHEYNDDIASGQYVTYMYGYDCSVNYVQQYVAGVMGEPEGIEIVYE